MTIVVIGALRVNSALKVNNGSILVISKKETAMNDKNTSITVSFRIQWVKNM